MMILIVSFVWEASIRLLIIITIIIITIKSDVGAATDNAR